MQSGSPLGELMRSGRWSQTPIATDKTQQKGRAKMRKTKLTARVNTYDIFGNTSIVEFPIYTENDRLFAKVMGEYISVFHPDMLKNGIQIMQPIKNR